MFLVMHGDQLPGTYEVLGPSISCHLLPTLSWKPGRLFSQAALPLPTCPTSLCGKETDLITFSRWLLRFFSGGKGVHVKSETSFPIEEII